MRDIIYFIFPLLEPLNNYAQTSSVFGCICIIIAAFIYCLIETSFICYISGLLGTYLYMMYNKYFDSLMYDDPKRCKNKNGEYTLSYIDRHIEITPYSVFMKYKSIATMCYCGNNFSLVGGSIFFGPFTLFVDVLLLIFSFIYGIFIGSKYSVLNIFKYIFSIECIKKFCKKIALNKKYLIAFDNLIAKVLKCICKYLKIYFNFLINIKIG